MPGCAVNSALIDRRTSAALSLGLLASLLMGCAAHVPSADRPAPAQPSTAELLLLIANDLDSLGGRLAELTFMEPRVRSVLVIADTVMEERFTAIGDEELARRTALIRRAGIDTTSAARWVACTFVLPGQQADRECPPKKITIVVLGPILNRTSSPPPTREAVAGSQAETLARVTLATIGPYGRVEIDYVVVLRRRGDQWKIIERIPMGIAE